MTKPAWARSAVDGDHRSTTAPRVRPPADRPLAVAIAAVLVGVALGVVYGWVGAQSLLGAINGSPGLVPPGMPWELLGVIAVCAAALTWAASVTPSRRATSVSPVAALAVD